MADQLLVSSITVTALGVGASITLPHGLKANGKAVTPNQILCDRTSPIGVSSANATSVTFFNFGSVPETAVFRVEYDHSIHAVNAAPFYWKGFVSGGSGIVLSASFSDTTDQALPVGSALAVKFNTTEFSNGGIVVANNGLGQPTRLTVPVDGLYAFDISPQLLNTGGGGSTITFWARIDGTNVPRSASSLEMGNNNNRTLPFLQLDLQMTAGQYLEWMFTATGVNTSLEHFPASAGPPIIPEIPSVIANVHRISS